MKVVGLGLLVAGGMVAVGGILVSEAAAMRLVASLVGLATSLSTPGLGRAIEVAR